MAGRPQKRTVDFFSHDANAHCGRTLTILFNHFGHEGLSAWWLLLESLAGTSGHFLTIQTDEDLEYMAGNFRLPPDRLRAILDKMAALNAIDPDLYSHGYIWSQNFVERLQPVYESRKQLLPQKPISCPDKSISLANNAISLPDNTTKETIETKLERLERVSAPAGAACASDTSRTEGELTPQSAVNGAIACGASSAPKGKPNKPSVSVVPSGAQSGTTGSEPTGKPDKPTVPKASNNSYIAAMQEFLGYPAKTDKDPVPNPGKEAAMIAKMLRRGFAWSEILAFWKERVGKRGEFVSMVWINEDIGKPSQRENGGSYGRAAGQRPARSGAAIAGGKGRGTDAAERHPEGVGAWAEAEPSGEESAGGQT